MEEGHCLSVKLAMYGESLMFKRRFRRLKRKRLWMRCLRFVLGVISLPIFNRDVVVGRRDNSLRVCNIRFIGRPQQVEF